VRSVDFVRCWVVTRRRCEQEQDVMEWEEVLVPHDAGVLVEVEAGRQL
jgi:hypothetical protein